MAKFLLITEEQYQKLLKNQKGQCAICNTTVKGRLCTDHEHGTRTIRGLLCRSCNLGLALFKDNPEFLVNASNYLRNYTKWLFQ